MFAFLLMNLIVGVSAFLLTYKFFKLSSFSDSIITLFLLYFSQIVYTEILLGVAGALYLKNLLLFNLTVLLLVWLITHRREYSFSFKGISEKLNALFEDKVILLLIAILLGFGLVKIFVNLVNPPFGWDSLNYHFTFPVEWLKHGNLENPITVSDDPSPPYYPINGSLFFFWLILPFKSVFLADLGQAPFFLAAFLAVYSLGRKLNLEEKYAFFSAALFTLIPNYFKQLQIAYVDVMVAALFLVGLNYLLNLKTDFSFKNTLLFALATGLLLGTKTTALPYALLLLIPFLYLSIREAKKAPPLLISVVLLILLFGGFTYIRNFIDTGNPLYPLDFRLYGHHIFKGVMDSATYAARFQLKDYSLTKALFHEGLGLQTILFSFPFLFLALPLAFIKRRKELDFHLAYFLILPLMIYLVFRYIIPLANLRYLYNLMAIGVLLGFYSLRALNFPRRIVSVLVGICAIASAFELAKRQELIAGIAVTVVLFFLFPVIFRKPKLTIFFLIFSFCVFPLLERYYIKNEYPRYAKMVKYSGFWPDATRAWDWLNQNTSGNNIAYIGRPVPFPLYGTNFKNRVYYVSVNLIDPAKLEYYPYSRYQWGADSLSLHKNLEAKGNYRYAADYSLWLGNLLRHKTDYLFVYSLHQTAEVLFPIEDSWAKINPARFAPAFMNETIHVYKVMK